MATTQTTPETPALPILEVRKSVFDLKSKDYVVIGKNDSFSPVASVDEFVNQRMGNDAKAILEVLNDGLMEYERKRLASDESKPWQLVEEDEDGKETLSDFDGQPISPDKGKQLSALVIQFAKLLFGYSKQMVAGDKEANRKAKAEAKAKALAAVLSNESTVEALKG